jgi:protein-S-isoprenylcysteine O-methyltransferase Ste14
MDSLARIAPYLATGLVVVVELVTLRRPRKDAQARDRGTFWVIQIAISAGMWSAFTVWQRPVGFDLHFGSWIAALGLALAFGGAAFRLWAIHTLGQFFTRDIEISASQTVVDTGPYRLVRHPSYSGSLLEFLGVGLSLRSLLGLLLAFLPALISMAYRMHVEERVLLDALGDPYRAYVARTKRLVPYLI